MEFSKLLSFINLITLIFVLCFQSSKTLSFEIEDRSKTYDISSGVWIKLIDLASQIKDITNCKLTKGDIMGTSLLIDNKDFVPGWEPKISLNDGLKRMIKEF